MQISAFDNPEACEDVKNFPLPPQNYQLLKLNMTIKHQGDTFNNAEDHCDSTNDDSPFGKHVDDGMIGEGHNYEAKGVMNEVSGVL